MPNKIEQKFKIITENLQDIIWMIDFKTQKYTFIAGAVEELTGFTVEEFLNMSLKDSVPFADYQYIIKEFDKKTKEYSATGILPRITHEVHLRKKNGDMI
jgi:PAS domain S-box-containing protein